MCQKVEGRGWSSVRHPTTLYKRGISVLGESAPPQTANLTLENGSRRQGWPWISLPGVSPEEWLKKKKKKSDLKRKNIF